MGVLSNPIRKKILLMLRERGKMRYTDMLRELDISTGKLNYHLRELQGYIRKDENGLYYLTERGRRELEVRSRKHYLLLGLTLMVLSPFIARLNADVGQGTLVVSTIFILVAHERRFPALAPVLGLAGLLLPIPLFEGGWGLTFYLPWKEMYSIFYLPASTPILSAFLQTLLLRDWRHCVFSSIFVSAIPFALPLLSHAGEATMRSLGFALWGFSSLALIMIMVEFAYLALARYL